MSTESIDKVHSVPEDKAQTEEKTAELSDVINRIFNLRLH